MTCPAFPLLPEQAAPRQTKPKLYPCCRTPPEHATPYHILPLLPNQSKPRPASAFLNSPFRCCLTEPGPAAPSRALTLFSNAACPGHAWPVLSSSQHATTLRSLAACPGRSLPHHSPTRPTVPLLPLYTTYIAPATHFAFRKTSTAFSTEAIPSLTFERRAYFALNISSSRRAVFIRLAAR